MARPGSESGMNKCRDGLKKEATRVIKVICSISDLIVIFPVFVLKTDK